MNKYVTSINKKHVREGFDFNFRIYALAAHVSIVFTSVTKRNDTIPE